MDKSVIEGGFCVGCGACASLNDTPYKMSFQNGGFYLPIKADDALPLAEFDSICPFSGACLNEDELSKEMYDDHNAEHDPNIGYYKALYAGYVQKGSFRKDGSSGGAVTWLANKLLEENLVDSVIHAKQSVNGDSILFEYGISKTLKELKLGAKSKYYPIEISQVIRQLVEVDRRYVFIGVPCFVKAVRLLARKEPIIKERIKYTIGLFCGHLKTDRFAKSMAWEMGIPPDTITEFDFRIKTNNERASQYQVKAIGSINGQKQQKQELAKKLFVSNWGYGFFKLKACDYCDDVVAETADVSIGDAWLPEYVDDPAGNNVVIIRNQTLLDLFKRNMEELSFKQITPEQVFQSQAGGFRHRRQGLAYRLYMVDQKNIWYPKKRVQASNSETIARCKIYEKRVELRDESYTGYNKAEKANDFNVFIQHMNPYIREYDKLNRPKGLALFLSVVKGLVSRLLRKKGHLFI